jgi:hypothetical protein
MTLVFTLCFLAYSFLIGKFYEKFHLSRTVWIIFCVVLTEGLAVVFIIDTFFVKHEKNQDNLEK